MNEKQFSIALYLGNINISLTFLSAVLLFSLYQAQRRQFNRKTNKSYNFTLPIIVTAAIPLLIIVINFNLSKLCCSVSIGQIRLFLFVCAIDWRLVLESLLGVLNFLQSKNFTWKKVNSYHFIRMFSLKQNYIFRIFNYINKLDLCFYKKLKDLGLNIEDIKKL